MDATVSHSDESADQRAQTLVFQPELLSQRDLEALCRRAVVEAVDDALSPADQRTTCDEWNSCTEALQSLGHLAVIGSAVPDFASWPRYSRRMARLVARCVQFLSWFLILRQTRFNAASVNVLHDFAQQLARNQVSHGGAVRRVELRLQERIAALEARVAELQSEVIRVRSAQVAP